MVVLCILVNSTDILEKLTTKRIPREKINRILKFSLAQIIHGFLREHNVDSVHADGEIREILKQVGCKCYESNFVSLADISAWINKRYSQSKNKPYSGRFKEINVKERLFLLVSKRLK